MGYTSSKPTAVVWPVHWAPGCWCPGWPILPGPQLPSSGRVPSTCSKGRPWDQLRFLLTFSFSGVFLLGTMDFFFTCTHKEVEALLVELLVQRLGSLLCVDNQLPLHIGSALRRERAGQILSAWNTDLTMHCWGCLPPGVLGRGSDGKWDIYIDYSLGKLWGSVRGLICWGLGHCWDLATSKPRGADSTHIQLAWDHVEATRQANS